MFLIIVGLRLSCFSQTADSIIIDNWPTIQTFKGSQDSIYSYLNTIDIPDIFFNDSIKGLIILEILIDTSGQVKDCKIVKSLLPQIDSLFYDKIMQMPKWSSGTNNFVCALPIKFNNYIIDDKKIRDIIKEIYTTKK